MKFLYHGYIIEYEFENNNFEKTILFLHGWRGNLNSFQFLKKKLSGYNFLSVSYKLSKRFLPFAIQQGQLKGHFS